MGTAPPYEALTIKGNGRLAQLISVLKISVVFDVKAPPNPLPDTVETKALWDTGVSRSVISQDLAKQLNLVPTGATNVVHAGGTSISPTHVVNFYLPNNVGIAGVLVTEFPGTGNFGAIIGMDVISLGDLAITNLSGQTWMSFRIPSQGHIDYVNEHAKALYSGVGRNEPCPCGTGKKFKHCHGAFS